MLLLCLPVGAQKFLPDDPIRVDSDRIPTGQYDDPVGERHLVETLIKRRDKTVAHDYRQLNPPADFRLAGTPEAPALEFRDLGEESGLGKAEAYEYQWFAFDNASGRLEPLPATSLTPRAVLPLPRERPGHVMARIRTRSATRSLWRKGVDVYVRTAGGGSDVGIEREN